MSDRDVHVVTPVARVQDDAAAELAGTTPPGSDAGASPGDMNALQARIQNARARLRSAQASLLVSLEQVSTPSSSPTKNPRPSPAAGSAAAASSRFAPDVFASGTQPGVAETATTFVFEPVIGELLHVLGLKYCTVGAPIRYKIFVWLRGL